MYVMIDNYDSYVYNLAACFRELDREIRVIRSGELDPEELEKADAGGELDGLILSPGPGHPQEAPVCRKAVEQWAGRVPLLGVCLGHQVIGHVFGAGISRGERPAHGKVTELRNNGKGLFSGLPESFRVTRYHSLVIDRKTLPAFIRTDAFSEDGAVMAISLSRKNCPVYGVQFHPEAVLTEFGCELLKNFMLICESRKRERGGSR